MSNSCPDQVLHSHIFAMQDLIRLRYIDLQVIVKIKGEFVRLKARHKKMCRAVVLF